MNMEKTVVAIAESGFEPMFLAYGFLHHLGDVVVPKFYDRQLDVAKREGFKDLYLDPQLGEILKPFSYHDNYKDHLEFVLENYSSVKKELIDYLRGFEVASIEGRVKRFKSPDVEINIGLIMDYRPENGYYTYPSAQSKFLNLLPEMYGELESELPVDVEDVDRLSQLAQEIEESYRIAFVPEINSLSYTSVPKLKNEISTPHLKEPLINEMGIPKSIYVSLSGHKTRAEDILTGLEQLDVPIYSPPESEEVWGNKAPPSLIYNPNVIAVVARIGWGTTWKALQAGKPIITPEFKEGDHPEAFHNNKTLKALDFGVTFDGQITKITIEEAVDKTKNIEKLNRGLIRKFGTLDGLRFARDMINRDIVAHPLF